VKSSSDGHDSSEIVSRSASYRSETGL
jgi:hypothetical protein